MASLLRLRSIINIFSEDSTSNMPIIMLQDVLAFLIPIRFYIPMALIQYFPVFLKNTLSVILSDLWSHLDGGH